MTTWVCAGLDGFIRIPGSCEGLALGRKRRRLRLAVLAQAPRLAVDGVVDPEKDERVLGLGFAEQLLVGHGLIPCFLIAQMRTV